MISQGSIEDMNQKLGFFSHIPKCSGTSICVPFLRCHQSNVFWHGVNFDSRDILKVIEQSSQRSILFCGHFQVKDFLSQIRSISHADIKIFSSLREPISRIVSYHSHIINNNDHPGHLNVSSNIEDALDGFFGNMIRSQPQSAFLQPVSLAEGQKRSEAICKIAREGLLKVYSSQQVEDCIMEISRFMSLPIDPNQIEKKNTSKIPTINKLDNMTPEVIEKINEITTYDRNLIDMLSPWFPEKG